jgi:hypothetical protein
MLVRYPSSIMRIYLLIRFSIKIGPSEEKGLASSTANGRYSTEPYTSFYAAAHSYTATIE